MSRISTNQIFDGAQNHVTNAKEREIDSADHSSSLKRIVRPSQDPTGWVTAANIKDDLSVRDTIAKNANLANHFLTASENVLSQLQEYVSRAHQLAVAASSSGTVTEGTRQSVLTELEGLWHNSISALNTNYAGRSLFGGFQSRTPAYTEDGTFRGDNNDFRIEVGRNLVIPVNISSSQIIEGKGNSLNPGIDILGTFQRLMSGLRMDDVDAVRGTLEDLLSAIDQISNGRTLIGARQSELERAVNSHETEKIERLDTVSKIEEADPIKAFSDLARDQTVLRATISTSEKILADDPLNIFFK